MIRKQLTVLALLLIIAGVIYFLSGTKISVPSLRAQPVTLGEQIRTGKTERPVFASSTEEKLKASKGFQYLASYTDHGFEPAEITMKKGETIRFTNNSSNELWIAADGTNVQIYPRTKSVCGSSDLDSCEPFSPQDFWEFTFGTSGEWHVVNNLDKSKGAVVSVE